MPIASPSALASITHDETSGNQAFAPQQWQVKANSIKGASISFSTKKAFTHTLDKTFKRDVRLDVSIASSDGPANWIALKKDCSTGGNVLGLIGRKSSHHARRCNDVAAIVQHCARVKRRKCRGRQAKCGDDSAQLPTRCRARGFAGIGATNCRAKGGRHFGFAAQQ